MFINGISKIFYVIEVMQISWSLHLSIIFILKLLIQPGLLCVECWIKHTILQWDEEPHPNTIGLSQYHLYVQVGTIVQRKSCPYHYTVQVEEVVFDNIPEIVLCFFFSPDPSILIIGFHVKSWLINKHQVWSFNCFPILMLMALFQQHIFCSSPQKAYSWYSGTIF